MNKKILVLEPFLDQLGGSEKMAFEVAKGLAGAGWEIHLGFVRDGSSRNKYASFVKKFHAVPAPAMSIRKPWQVLQVAKKINQKIKEENIQLIFSSCFAYILSAAVLERLYRIPVSFHLGLQSGVVNTLGGRLASREISAGIVPSKIGNNSWIKLGWENDKLHIVPNWIDWKQYRNLPSKEQARKMLGIGTAAPARRGLGATSAGEREGAGGRELKVVAYVGRLVQEKGIEVLLEAWNRSFGKQRNRVLLIAGHGEPEYAAKLKAKATENVKFLGQTKKTNLVYRASDLTVVPSQVEETFGLVPLESIACGTLPLVSNSGFLPFIVNRKRKGLIFSFQNKKELTSKMKRLLLATNLSMLKNIKKECKRKFSKKEGIKKYEAILSLLCMKIN